MICCLVFCYFPFVVIRIEIVIFSRSDAIYHKISTKISSISTQSSEV